MSLIKFIGNRFAKNYKGAFSNTVVRISSASIIISTVVILISIFILKGFQNEIKRKIIGINGEIVIRRIQNSSLDLQYPINFQSSDIKEVHKVSSVSNVFPIADKMGIIKARDQIEGSIFRGITNNFSKSFIAQSIVEGHFPHFQDTAATNEILISRTLANRLNCKCEDDLFMLFLVNNESTPRIRKLKISGIYETGFAEFDKQFVFGDIRHVQKFNSWSENEASSVILSLKHPDYVYDAYNEVTNILDFDKEILTVFDFYPDIFSWLSLLDTNVTVIITIMLVVTLINIVTILLIRILEKTNAIGVLKTLGLSNLQVRKTFIYVALVILIKSIIIGNAIAFTMGFLQKYFKIFQLNAETYFINYVPISFDVYSIIWVNILILIVSLISLVVPSMIVAKIYPARTLRLK